MIRGWDKSIVTRWLRLSQETLSVRRWQLHPDGSARRPIIRERTYNLTPASARRAERVNVARAMRAA